MYYLEEGSRVSSVGITTSYWLDIGGSWQRQEFFLLHKVQTCSGAKPASYSVGNLDDLSGCRRPGHGADHSPRFNAELENDGAYVHSPICLHGIVLN
jgi:hypothetical protein